MYGVESIFWLKLLLLLSIVGLSLFLFNTAMRRLLKVKKRKIFSYNHLNQKHKTFDWAIRIVFLILLLVGFMINSSREPSAPIWFLQTYFILFVFIFATEILRAYMEWKYDENEKAYIFTISQLSFIGILLFTLFTTDFWGWFG